MEVVELELDDEFVLPVDDIAFPTVLTDIITGISRHVDDVASEDEIMNRRKVR